MKKWYKVAGYEKNGVHVSRVVVLKARTQKEAITKAFPSGKPTDVVVKRVKYSRVQQLGL